MGVRGISIKNALFQAEYLYGVKIVANKELSQAQTGGQQFSIKFENSDVDIGGEEKPNYFIANQCQKNGTLFSNVKIVGNLDKKSVVRVDDLAWFTNPKHFGDDGAVGVVDWLVASGLVSDQIKLAIKRASTELAFEKNSQISGRTTVKTSDDNGLVKSIKLAKKRMFH
ncbi:MAG: hypothetical protein DSZ28_09220 [Thiothrix sp.]|nr:MAG: hypothetical protein DSZ28_09220 [Thiothrix sp.]